MLTKRRGHAVDYFWLGQIDEDLEKGVRIRTKRRFIEAPSPHESIDDQAEAETLSKYDWDYDGSSTHQADRSAADLPLRVTELFPHPFLGEGNLMAWAMVMDRDENPHKSNLEASLLALEAENPKLEPWLTAEQEYFLVSNETNLPLGWPRVQDLMPLPQARGHYYCAPRAVVRGVMEEFWEVAMAANLEIWGDNAEVAPGQAEFQVGGKGSAARSARHIWMARELLAAVAAKHGCRVDIRPKPIEGPWNGSGGHINWSTRAMREPGGIEHIQALVRELGSDHDNVIGTTLFGDGNDERLVGDCEAPDRRFRCSSSDRGASIRIPLRVEKAKMGYLEDRRYGSSFDPFAVATYFMERSIAAEL